MSALHRMVVMAVLVLAATAAQGQMEYTARLRCPLDQQDFTYVLDFEGSGTSVGMRLDLKPLGHIPSPWRLAQCPSCGFVLYKKEFNDSECVQLREIMQTTAYHDARKLASTYYCLAQIYRSLGRKDFEIAWTLIQASWQVESDSARYTACVVQALTFLARVVEKEVTPKTFQQEMSIPSDGVIAAYLCVELHRISGRFDRARAYLDKLRPVKGEDVAGFNKMVQCQRKLVANRDRSRKTITSCR
jgi:hypothetical protein